MEQEVVSTRTRNIDAAVEELCSKLKHNLNDYNAVIFTAAIDYDFFDLSEKLKAKFPESEVIGTSTAGEISPSGFSTGSIVLTTMKDAQTRCKGVFIDQGSKFPIIYKKDIEQALTSCGIRCGDPNSHRDAFALEFTNGIFNAEETILSNFYAIIKNDNFMLAGGTAGYTGNEPKSFVSYNGKVTQDGAVMLFVKTRCAFDIRQEDIFNPTGKRIFVTKSDTVNREIFQINGRPATQVYAEQLGMSEAEAANNTFANPFGRFLNGNTYIAALAGMTPQKSITTFARITPNSTLELMKLGNPLEKCDETCQGIKEKIPSPKFTFLMTCITRTMHFESIHISNEIIRKYNNAFPSFAGFSCYGEQIGRIHCNQTLVSLVIGD